MWRKFQVIRKVFYYKDVFFNVQFFLMTRFSDAQTILPIDLRCYDTLENFQNGLTEFSINSHNWALTSSDIKKYKKIGCYRTRFSKNDPLLIFTFCIENIGKNRKKGIFRQKNAPKKIILLQNFPKHWFTMTLIYKNHDVSKKMVGFRTRIWNNGPSLK